MRIIPVLDLLSGTTVHAVAGQRSEYRPIRSCLTDSVDPSVVLQRLNEVCQSNTAYIADLDAILRQAPNRCTLAELSRLGIRLMVDAGVQSVEDAQQLFELGIDSVVIGLESLPDPETAKELLARFDPASLILSVDLNNGTSLARSERWQQLTADVLLEELSTLGFRRWIILDIASVGTSDGISTLSLCRQLRTLRPDDDHRRRPSQCHRSADVGAIAGRRCIDCIGTAHRRGHGNDTE